MTAATPNPKDRPSRLSDSDLAYHRKMVANRDALQAALNASWGPWAQHLYETYELGETGEIKSDGTIVWNDEAPPAS